MKRGARLLVSVLALLASGQSGFAADSVGYAAILNGNWTLAEQQLLAGLRKNPDNVFRLLNLAWVYAQTGRREEAEALYQRILSREEDRLAQLPSGEGRSVKALAEHGLALLHQRP